MEEFRRTHRDISLRALGLALVLAAVALVYGRVSHALGVLAGCGFSLIIFRLLARSILRIMENTDPRRARVQAMAGYASRYLLTALFLFAVLLYPELDFLSAAVGLLLVKAVIVGGAVLSFLSQRIRHIFNPARWERGD